MSKFIHVGTFTTGWSRNLTDLALTKVGTKLMLYGVTHVGAGLSAWSVDGASGKAPTLVGNVAYPTWLGHMAEPEIVLIDRPGFTSLLTAGAMKGSETGRVLATTGLPAATDTGLTRAALPYDLLTADGFTTAGGHRMLLVARHERPEFTLWRQPADGSVTQIAVSAPPGLPYRSQVDSLQAVRIGSVDLIVSASTLGNYVAVHQLGPGGRLMAGEFLGSTRGTGFNGPRHVEHVEVDGRHFLVVASAGSSSLTTIRILPGGQLIANDHVLDEGTTRFKGATEMTAVRLGNRSFVIAGGGDDGLSLFTVSPDGRLIHLHTIVDTAGMALANVSALTARVEAGKIVVMAASATERGISQFIINPGVIGVTTHARWGLNVGTSGADLIQGSVGTTVIKGEGGDDVLISGPGPTELYGGQGADRFVPLAVSGRVVIRDFQPAEDQIDLSMLGMIRSLAQVRITTTPWGMRLQFGTTQVDVRAERGVKLTPSMISDSLFSIAHYKPPDVRSTIVGTSRAEVLNASRGGSTVSGYGGNDTIFGSAVEDRLLGGAGDDSIRAWGSNDTVSGDLGHDRLWGGSGRDSLLGGAGNDSLWGESENDTLSGGDDNDRLSGGAGNDWLEGEAGNDALVSDGGNDTLLGGSGDDTLMAASGLNVMSDLSGNNLLQGGTQRDIMTTGAGRDTLSGGGGDDSLSAGDGLSLIHI